MTWAEQQAVYRQTKLAVRRGELRRSPCEVCGDVKTDAHHEDYARPVDVRWLCRKHHRMHHGQWGFWDREAASSRKVIRARERFLKCPRCAYEWWCRVLGPKACPRCKVRLDRVLRKDGR